MEVSKELRADIERNQTKLKIAIRNHQMLVLKLKADPDNVMVKYDLKAAQNDIISIGLDQKELIERLRKELKIHQKNVKTNATKTGIEERRCNLNNILSKSRKQTLTSRSASVSSVSTDDSLDVPSAPPSPAPPLLPHELSQVDFLGRMGLCTHDVFKELQNKRVERKRRSTANPHFLYGNRWDHSTKRKKNAYLMSLSPPNTRQATKNKLKEQQQQQRTSPPLTQSSNRSDSRSSSPVNSGNSNASNGNKKPGAPVPMGLNIPNLPSGLTIERVNGNKQSADSRVCLVCRTSGSLSVCETCSGSFHVRCHNRPLVQQPRHCPKCLSRKDSGSGSRDVGALSVPPSMTVLTSYVSAEVKEKAQEKSALLEQNQTLLCELDQLEKRAEQLTVSLHSQRSSRDELLDKQRHTEQNIRRLLQFVNAMKGLPPPPPTPPGAPTSPPPLVPVSSTARTTPPPTQPLPEAAAESKSETQPQPEQPASPQEQKTTNTPPPPSSPVHSPKPKPEAEKETSPPPSF